MEVAVHQVLQHKDFSTKFKHPLKFDGENYVEVRLGHDEQQIEVTKLAGKSPHVFLERYGDLLSREELVALRAACQQPTPEVQFWLDRLLREPPNEAERAKKARRRRWNWAKLQMAKGDGYFSEEEMKRREPKLFLELVGKHLEPATQLNAPMKGGLSAHLLQQIDREEFEHLINTGPEGRGEDENGCRPSKTRRRNVEDPMGEVNMDEEGDVDMVVSDTEGGSLDIADRRAQFLKAMRNRFVNGHEREFAYGDVDADSDLDDLTELSRDAEERYFDEG